MPHTGMLYGRKMKCEMGNLVWLLFLGFFWARSLDSWTECSQQQSHLVFLVKICWRSGFVFYGNDFIWGNHALVVMP